MPTPPAQDRDPDAEPLSLIASEDEEHNPQAPANIEQPRQPYRTGEREPPTERRRAARTIHPDEPIDEVRAANKRTAEWRIKVERAKRSDAEHERDRIRSENDRLRQQLHQRETASLTAAEAEVKAREARATKDFTAAYQAGDADAAVAAQTELTRASIEAERIRVAKQQPPPQVQQTDGFDESRLTPKVKAWTDNNRWFVENPRMRESAVAMHWALTKAGIPVESKKYFDLIEKQIVDLYPDEFSDEPDEPLDDDQDESGVAPPRRLSPVASPSREPSAPRGAPGRSGKIRLNTEQESFCRANGIDPDAYRKSLERRAPRR